MTEQQGCGGKRNEPWCTHRCSEFPSPHRVYWARCTTCAGCADCRPTLEEREAAICQRIEQQFLELAETKRTLEFVRGCFHGALAGRTQANKDVARLLGIFGDVDRVCPNYAAALLVWNALHKRATDAEDGVKLLREAVRAHNAWFLAETKNLGTFQDRMNLCSYAEWTGKLALAGESEPFEGVPQIIVFPKVTRECINEEAARELIVAAEHAALEKVDE